MGNVMHRGKGSFTHVENTVFFDRSLSLKAKGIYCQIRSLESNPEWVFTIRGFASLVRDGVDAVTAGIKELEAAGYIIRARKRSENGRFLKAEEVLALPQNQPNAPLYPAGGAPGSRPGALPHFGRPRYLGPPPRARSTAG